MVKKRCGHAGAEVDPHPYCDECAPTEASTSRICIPGFTCEHCDELQPIVWKLITRYRENKIRRRKINSDRREESVREICDNAKLSRRAATSAVSAVVIPDDTSTVDYRSESTEAQNQLFEFLDATPPGSDFSFPSMGSKKEVKKPSTSASAVTKATLAKKHARLLEQMEKEMAAANAPEDVKVSSKPTKTSSRASSTTSVKQTKRGRSPSPIVKEKKSRRSRSKSPVKHSSKTARHRSDSDRREKRRSPDRRSHSSQRQAKKRRSLSRSVSRQRKEKRSFRDEISRSRSRTPRRDTRRDQRSYSSQRSNRSYTLLLSQRRKAEQKEERRRHDVSYREDRYRSRSPRTRRTDRRSDSRDRRHRRHRASFSPSEVMKQAQKMFDSYREKQLAEDGEADDFDSDDEADLAEPSKTVFPFKEVIEIMATNSDVELKEGASFTSRGFQMASDDPTSNVKKEFKALTTSMGLVEATKLWQQDFAKRDAKKKKVKRGDFVKCSKLRSSLRSYKSGDDWLTMDPLYHEKQTYAWLAQPSTHIKVSQPDMIHMEGQMRSILRVINFQEVLNQTVNAGLEQAFEAEVMLKLHKCYKQATRDLIKLSTGMFCGIAQMRKDDILVRSPKIPAKLEFKMRHTEIAEVQNMFPEEVLVEIDGVYTQQLSATVMETYTGKGRGGYANKQTRQKGYSGYQGGNQQGGYHQDSYQREFKRGRGRGYQGGSR